MFKVPSDLKQNFKYCFNGGNTGLDSLINLQGYYTMGYISGNYPYIKNKNYYSNNISKRQFDYNTIENIDTLDIHLMFFKDGTFLYNFFSGNRQKSISEYFKWIVEAADEREKNRFYKGYRWGSYIVSNDTIKAQWFNIPGSLNDSWYSGEVWFQILSKNELQEINHPKSMEQKEKAKKGGIARFNSLPARFTPVEILPNPDAKIKEEEWFWCKPTKI
ncbi:hypothetical protein [Rufibacter roseus]|uniref:Uncharacterized protein n=1 Tax=Rufibacter roseus TaxID=1567108 RepID=A0ABW2DUX1_9BACT|nr:hypothetical protein [Rufibacter roseus]